jgi:polar amino acid transport system permease protein
MTSTVTTGPFAMKKFAVLPPSSMPVAPRRSWGDWGLWDAPKKIFTRRVLFMLLAVFALSVLAGEVYAQVNGQQRPGVLQTIWRWLPLILFGPSGQVGGFVLNILVSFLTMAIGTVTGVVLGVLLVTRGAIIRWLAWAVTQFFRNSPWLVLLFFAILLLPYRMNIFGTIVPFPDWIKAVIGLALPIMANIAEVTRGAINSIPTGQWESSESLAFSRPQTFRLIILPQCFKRMLPPWMNWYAILTMATTLISIIGVSDSMTLTQQALAAEGGRSELLIPMYLLLLMLFFVYCYPIARFTQYLERRYAVVT